MITKEQLVTLLVTLRVLLSEFGFLILNKLLHLQQVFLLTFLQVFSVTIKTCQ